MRSKRDLLILSTDTDVHARAVGWALRHGANANVFDFSSENYPASCEASIHVRREGLRVSIQDGMQSADLGNSGLVIWRRRVPPPTLATNLHPSDVDAARLESKDFINCLLMALEMDGHVWINSARAAILAQNKLLQLIVARTVGFCVPETLISNNPAEIRAFGSALGGAMAVKAFYPRMWSCPARKVAYFASTARVELSRLGSDSSLGACPAIYQEYVKKAFELRVTVLGDDVSAIRIDSQVTRETADWRYDKDGGESWGVEEYALAPSLRDRVLKYMKALNLAMGCIDLIVTPDDRVVFLEVNEQGQFLWIEERLPETKLLQRFCRFLAGAMGLPSDAEWPSFSDYRESSDYSRLLKFIELDKREHPLYSEE